MSDRERQTAQLYLAIVNPDRHPSLSVYVHCSSFAMKTVKAIATPAEFRLRISPWVYVLVTEPGGQVFKWGYYSVARCLRDGFIVKVDASNDELPAPLNVQPYEWQPILTRIPTEMTLPTTMIYIQTFLSQVESALKGGNPANVPYSLDQWQLELFANRIIAPVALYGRSPAMHTLDAEEIHAFVENKYLPFQAKLMQSRLETVWATHLTDIACALAYCLVYGETVTDSMLDNNSPVDDRVTLQPPPEGRLREYHPAAMHLRVPFELAFAAIGNRKCVLANGSAYLDYAGMLTCAPSWYEQIIRHQCLRVRTRAQWAEQGVNDERFDVLRVALTRLLKAPVVPRSLIENSTSISYLKQRGPRCVRAMIEAYERDIQSPKTRKKHGQQTLSWAVRPATIVVLAHCGVNEADLTALTSARIERCYEPRYQAKEKVDARKSIENVSKLSCYGCKKLQSLGWCGFPHDIEDGPMRACSNTIALDAPLINSPARYVKALK